MTAPNPGIHFAESGYSQMESYVFGIGHHSLANFMRTMRSLNPYPDKTPQYDIWHDETQFNIPVLILASFYLNEFCKKKGKSKVLFSARDSVHWLEIFKKLFPDYTSTYFYASRYVYDHPSVKYIKYVRDLYSLNSVIVDTQSSGQSCIHFFITYLNTQPTFVSIIREPATYQYHEDSIAGIWPEQVHSVFEKLNYQTQGSLIEYNQDGPICLPVEYDLEYVHPAHACIKK
jgi:hypothetical protein